MWLHSPSSRPCATHALLPIATTAAVPLGMQGSQIARGASGTADAYKNGPCTCLREDLLDAGRLTMYSSTCMTLITIALEALLETSIGCQHDLGMYEAVPSYRDAENSRQIKL